MKAPYSCLSFVGLNYDNARSPYRRTLTKECAKRLDSWARSFMYKSMYKHEKFPLYQIQMISNYKSENMELSIKLPMR